jgi:hypothetical protein
MTKQRIKKPISERIKDKIRELLEGLVEAVDGLMQPPLVPIPARGRRR